MTRLVRTVSQLEENLGFWLVVGAACVVCLVEARRAKSNVSSHPEHNG
jgi:hypothetical protein